MAGPQGESPSTRVNVWWERMPIHALGHLIRSKCPSSDTLRIRGMAPDCSHGEQDTQTLVPLELFDRYALELSRHPPCRSRTRRRHSTSTFPACRGCACSHCSFRRSADLRRERRIPGRGSMTPLHAAAIAGLMVLSATSAEAAPVGSPKQSSTDSMGQRALACTACHGDQGRSQADGYVPRLAGKPAGYLLAQLQSFRDGRRSHQTMSVLLQPLNDAMLARLAGHFAAQNVPYPSPVQPSLPETDGQRARKLVFEGDTELSIPACTACHGRLLTGVEPIVPSLLGLPVDYVVAQLGAWRTGHRRSHQPDCMAIVARRLPVEDVGRVARWLASQPIPDPSTAAVRQQGRWPIECAGISR